MITALAFALAVRPATRVIEVPEPGVGRVTIAAVLKLPELDPLGGASADVLSQLLVSDNDRYSKQEMRDLCLPGGQPRCYAMPDHLAIELSVYPADTGAGMRMLAGMVSTARMRLETMNSYVTSEPYRHKPVWTMAVDSRERAWDRLRAEDISSLYKWVCRPDNITIAVGGDVRTGQAQAAWEDATRMWRRQITVPLRKSDSFKDFPRVFGSHVLELRGPEVMPDDTTFPAKLLALIALGSGKSSSLFRDIRSQQAMSYRQEGVFWPTHDGFVPRLLIQIRPLTRDAESEQLAKIRTILIEDVDKWTESDILRAQGFAAAMATNGVDFSPLYFRTNAPLAQAPEDHTLLAAYWQMKSGHPWNGEAMAEAFKAIDLATVKEEATKMLKVAFPVMHPRTVTE